MGSLIGDLLMMTRGEDETLALNKEPIDIAGPLEEALLSAAALANQRSVSIVTDIEDAETVVAGDAFRLRQVIAIFLDNAICYSPQNGRVKIVSHVVENQWELIVHDNGIGIEPDALNHVFERNFRGNNARLHRPEGPDSGCPSQGIWSLRTMEQSRFPITVEKERRRRFDCHCSKTVPLSKPPWRRRSANHRQRLRSYWDCATYGTSGKDDRREHPRRFKRYCHSLATLHRAAGRPYY